MAGRGTAMRRRDRRMMSLWRHEQSSARMAMLTAGHHSCRNVPVVEIGVQACTPLFPIPSQKQLSGALDHCVFLHTHKPERISLEDLVLESNGETSDMMQTISQKRIFERFVFTLLSLPCSTHHSVLVFLSHRLRNSSLDAMLIKPLTLLFLLVFKNTVLPNVVVIFCWCRRQARAWKRRYPRVRDQRRNR